MGEKEWTKITNIPCRDCGKTVSILSGHKANIIEARCPPCKEAFDKKGEAYNKEIGYEPVPEPLSDGQVSDLATMCGFGLEYCILGKNYEKTTEMLNGGIKFCEITSKKGNELAGIIKGELELLLANPKALSEFRIREIQHFLNEMSEPYFRSHMKMVTKPLKRRRF